MSPEFFVWLALLVVFIVFEIITTSLSSIWFAGGALVAFIMACFGAPLWSEIIVFVVISLVLLFFTRPLLIKVFKVGNSKTNVDSIIGESAIVKETINNLSSSGCVSVNGQDWTARTEKDGEIIEPGNIVEVVSVSGVKLIVRNSHSES